MAEILKPYRLADRQHCWVTPVLSIYETRFRGAANTNCCLRGSGGNFLECLEAIASPTARANTKIKKVSQMVDKVEHSVMRYFEDEPRTPSIRAEECSMIYFCYHPVLNVRNRLVRPRADPNEELFPLVREHISSRLEHLDNFQLHRMCIYSHFYEYPHLVKNVLPWLNILKHRAIEQINVSNRVESGVVDTLVLAVGAISWLIYGWDRKKTPWKSYFLSSSGKIVRDILKDTGMLCGLPSSLVCGGIRGSFLIGDNRYDYDHARREASP